MEPTVKYNDGYNETAKLRNGDIVALRLIKPSDKELLQQGFSDLSISSRNKRFMASKQTITQEELKYFTELDEIDHLAIGVVELNSLGDETAGIGIARFIRIPSTPEIAEVALTVIDRMQGNGIGRLLLERLIEAAFERGITQFRFECLPHNIEMQSLVKKVCHVVDLSNSDGVMTLDVKLPHPLPSPQETASGEFTSIYDLLHVFATGALELQFNMGFEAVNQTLTATARNNDVWIKQWDSYDNRYPLQSPFQ